MDKETQIILANAFNNAKGEYMNEIWKDIPEFEGLYQVSNLGRVRSLPKEWVAGGGSMRKHNGGIMRARISNNGYHTINLSKEGKQKTIKVHQLVAMAFLGHIPNGVDTVVDHKNNDKLNNRLDNLQLISNRENLSKDKVGTSKYTGVYWRKQNSKWVVKISIGYKSIHLGYFDNNDEGKAAEMYQLALSNIDKYNGNPKEFRDYLNRKKNHPLIC